MALTPWSYRKGSSPLHKIGAGRKLAFLFFLSLAAFFPGSEIRSLAVLAGIVLIIAVLSVIAGIAPWTLLRGSGPLFIIVFAVFLFQGIDINPPGFSSEGIFTGAIFCIRIGAAFVAGSLLFAVTTITEIKKSITRLEAALHLEKIRIGLSISLMLAFLKRFFEIWEDINLAWKSRGGRRNLSHLIILAPLLLEKMMLKAAETASAMESRNGLDD